MSSYRRCYGLRDLVDTVNPENSTVFDKDTSLVSE